MSLLDKKLEFSDAQAVTSTADSTNTLDMQVADANLGAGKPLWLIVEVGETFANATSMKVTLQDSATDFSGATLIDSKVHLEAALVKGFRLLAVPLPAEHKRYLKLVYTVSGTHNAGAVNAYLTMGPQLKPNSP